MRLNFNKLVQWFVFYLLNWHFYFFMSNYSTFNCSCQTWSLLFIFFFIYYAALLTSWIDFMPYMWSRWIHSVVRVLLYYFTQHIVRVIWLYLRSWFSLSFVWFNLFNSSIYPSHITIENFSLLSLFSSSWYIWKKLLISLKTLLSLLPTQIEWSPSIYNILI